MIAGELTPYTSFLAATANAYDVVVFISAKLAADEILLPFKTPRDFSLPAALVGSTATAQTAPTNAVTIDLKKGATSIGSVVDCWRAYALHTMRRIDC